MNLAERNVLVTGGASGLGAACARRLAGAGAHVTITDRDESGADVAEEIGARFVVGDVADEQDMSTAIESASADGPLRALVHCAAMGWARSILGSNGPHDLRSWERVIRTNLTGTFNVVRLSAAAMAEAEPTDSDERGVIVLTSSAAAFDGVNGGVAYSASKAGVVGMTLPLARDLGRFQIRVMTIAPGTFETPMSAPMPTDYVDGLLAQTPFPGRLGKPDEFAALVEHVIANPMLNGETIRLDGALRMPPSARFR